MRFTFFKSQSEIRHFNRVRVERYSVVPEQNRETVSAYTTGDIDGSVGIAAVSMLYDVRTGLIDRHFDLVNRFFIQPGLLSLLADKLADGSQTLETPRKDPRHVLRFRYFQRQ